MVSAKALSKLSPTLPTDGSTPASASRPVYLIETYWVDSSGRHAEGAAPEPRKARLRHITEAHTYAPDFCTRVMG